MKVWNVIKNVLVWLVVAVAVFMMVFTIVSVTMFNRNDRDLFGYRAYIVNTNSMAGTFNQGDLIITKKVDPTTLEAGDIITFVSQSEESMDQTVTHKIRRRTLDAQGDPGFVTYGTATDSDDSNVVTFPYILGEYKFHLPKMGYFFNFLKTPQGYIVCIFVPFMLLIIYQGVNCIRLFRRYKKEQLAEMQAEKDKIEAERLENAKMMAELQALKAQLEKQAEKAPEQDQNKNEEVTVENDG